MVKTMLAFVAALGAGCHGHEEAAARAGGAVEAGPAGAANPVQGEMRLLTAELDEAFHHDLEGLEEASRRNDVPAM